MTTAHKQKQFNVIIVTILRCRSNCHYYSVFESKNRKADDKIIYIYKKKIILNFLTVNDYLIMTVTRPQSMFGEGGEWGKYIPRVYYDNVILNFSELLTIV